MQSAKFKQAVLDATCTFCLPVYNEERFISKAVHSILRQSESNFSILIADNNSTDQTSEICKALCKTDPRITYIRHIRNIGAAANFAFVINNCFSKYLCLMGAHDLLAENFLSSLLPYFDQYNSACLVYSQMSSINENDEIMHTSRGDNIDTRNLSPIAATWKIQTKLYGNMVYGIYRTDLLKVCHHNLICRGPDHVLVQELSLMGTIVHDTQPLYLMRNMAGINRPKSRSYDDFCRSQLLRIDPFFFSKGPRRIHWHWLLTTIFVIVTSKSSFTMKISTLPAALIGFLYRWRRQLIREFIKPLNAV